MTTVTTVLPSPGTTRLRPIDARGVRVKGGIWGDRLTINRETTIAHGLEQLKVSGALDNFGNAARRSGRYIGGIDDAGLVFPFLYRQRVGRGAQLVDDRIELELEMPPRLTLPHPAIDAVRGCAAIERGPLVYCVEQADLPTGAKLEDVEIDIDAQPTLAKAKDIPDEILAISVQARVRGDAAVGQQWPYRAMSDVHATPTAATAVTAIPYFAWANRETGPMRVWLPISQT